MTFAPRTSSPWITSVAARPTVPAPTTSAATTPAVWRVGIRIGFVLAFVAACAFIFSFATAPATLHNRANSLLPGTPGWLIALECSFFLLPFLTSLVLLFQTRRQGLMAAGSGIAFGFFGLFLLLSPFVFLTMFMLAGLSANQTTGRVDPGISHAFMAFLALIPISAWIVWCAILNGKSQWTAFTIAACVTVVYLFVGWGQLRMNEYRVGQKQQRAAEAFSVASMKTNYDAHRTLALLSGCLIQYHAAHPKAGFPASLNALPHDLQLPEGSACDPNLANPGAASGYAFTYTPQQDPSGAIFTDFRLLAMPLKKGLPRVDPMAVDSRGRIFVYFGWSNMHPEPGFAPGLVETPDDLFSSQTLSLRSEIRSFMQKNGGAPPASLSNLDWHPPDSATSDPNVWRAGPYELKYIPPGAAEPTRYSVSALCQKYGDACMRSFFLNQDGETHQTSEPRPATAQDPPIPDCEKFAQTCRDIDWPVPQ
ncbi:MAG TPA: hypothetical protein VJW93_08805 [Candidatus Acidoferrales bacterium]|nr:hypothetical protein [Candidatus Acidoferrales bacterium]